MSSFAKFCLVASAAMMMATFANAQCPTLPAVIQPYYCQSTGALCSGAPGIAYCCTIAGVSPTVACGNSPVSCLNTVGVYNTTAYL